MNQRELLKSVNEGNLSLVYLLHGNERLLMDKAVRAIKQKAVPEELIDFNSEYIDGEKTSLMNIIDVANMVPFMAEKRVVIVNQMPALQGTAKTFDGQKKEEEAFLEYLTNPNPQCCLIIKIDGKLDKRKKIYKMIQEMGAIVEYLPLEGAELEKWIVKYLRDNNRDIDQQAISYLSSMGSFSLEILQNELDKVILYSQDQGKININMLQVIITKSTETNVFDLIDSIAQRKAARAIGLLNDCLIQGEAPIKILFLLVRQFRQLLLIKDLNELGYLEIEIKDKLKVHPYVVTKGLKMGRQFTKVQLINFLEQLLKAEVTLKSTSVNGGELLESLIIDLCY